MIPDKLLPVLMFAMFAPLSAVAQDEKPKASTEPKDLPLELKIVSEVAIWELDSRGDPSFKFQENIRNGEKNGELVAPTRVDLKLEIRNTGKSSVNIWISGDATLLTLELKGPGAMTVEAKKAPPRGVIPPKAVTIPAGSSYQIPLTSLAHGFRLEAKHTYITELGSHQLSAIFKTGVSPAPPGTRGLGSGYGEVILKSAPIEFVVKRPS